MTTSMTMMDLENVAETLCRALDAKGSRKDGSHRTTVLTLRPLGGIKIDISHYWQRARWCIKWVDVLPPERQEKINDVLVALHKDIDDILAKMPKHLKG